MKPVLVTVEIGANEIQKSMLSKEITYVDKFA